VLVGTRTQVGFGGVRVRPRGEPQRLEGARPLFDGASLEGWRAEPEGAFEVDDEGLLVAARGPARIVAAGEGLADLELSARVKINEGGRAALWLRAREVGGALEGYAVEINSSNTAPAKTGSVRGLSEIRTHLVGEDTWFDLRLRCRDEEHGTRIQVTIDGALVADVLDPARRHAGGAVAITNEHEGSRLEVERLEVSAS